MEKKSYKNNKFKISAPKQNEKFELYDRSCYVSDVDDYFEYNKIVQTTRFNHTMIFFKLLDYNETSDIYINHNNCLEHILIAQLL